MARPEGVRESGFDPASGYSGFAFLILSSHR